MKNYNIMEHNYLITYKYMQYNGDYAYNTCKVSLDSKINENAIHSIERKLRENKFSTVFDEHANPHVIGIFELDSNKSNPNLISIKY